MTEIFVGGLPHAATHSQVISLFGRHGKVKSARLISEWFTGQPRGFGFVEMTTPEEAQAAISALNGFQLDGRTLIVKVQEPRFGGGTHKDFGSRRDFLDVRETSTRNAAFRHASDGQNDHEMTA